MNREFQWCRYRAYIYQCWERTATEALLTFPGNNAPGWVNVAPDAGPPLLMPAKLWVPLKRIQFFSERLNPSLPPIPFTAEFQAGSRCNWGTSLAEWAVLAVSGETAKIRQVSGWARAVVFNVPVSELTLIDQTNYLRNKIGFKSYG